MRLDIDQQTVQAGPHKSPEDGMCIMEMVAYIAGEQHSAYPVCVSPVIASFMRIWNDSLEDEDRQKLKALIPVVMDTASTREDEQRRGRMYEDWWNCEYIPMLSRFNGTRWQTFEALQDSAMRLVERMVWLKDDET